MILNSFRLPVADSEVLKAAASSKGISQSEFLRQAIKEKARRVLLGENNPESPDDRQALNR